MIDIDGSDWFGDVSEAGEIEMVILYYTVIREGILVSVHFYCGIEIDEFVMFNNGMAGFSYHMDSVLAARLV